ncbi:MAG TPA: zinc ABC transporter substrate-binding protein [Pirellulales bacterium]|nr:zinc ABC transporter substrate-binding protein [Pirellulales bacterium]
MTCWRWGWLALLAVGLMGGCREANSGNAPPRPTTLGRGVSRDQPLKAVCTTGMVADLVQRVGGELVRVDQLMGEGVDPHLYKASTGDIARLDAADLIAYSGLHLEGKMADLFVRMARRRATFAVTERIAEDRLLEVGAGHYDPHVWFDVALWSEALPMVAWMLAELDPSHAEDYRQRADAYRRELTELDAWCRARIATLPAERRILVTAHDAFHYFGRAYGLEVRAIQGISTESEAGVREINELVTFLVEHGIKAVFVETSVGERNVQALVEGCRAQDHEVRIGGELFSDAMGRPGTAEGTYVGMVRHNVETIVGALE